MEDAKKPDRNSDDEFMKFLLKCAGRAAIYVVVGAILTPAASAAVASVVEAIHAMSD
jgi:hypothetical protein